MINTIAVIGGSGAIGTAFIRLLSAKYPSARIHVFSRQPSGTVLFNVTHHIMDYQDEDSIAQAASLATQEAPWDYVMVTTGLLHDAKTRPEKSIRDCSAEKFQRLFIANTIFPTLVAKHFLPRLNKKNRSIFAVLSARVGSISDNRLGGWYAYRASKAALNMMIKNAAIETARSNRQAIIVGLHPGTVDSHLSKPFQANVPEGKLFTPDFSAAKLYQVLQDLETRHSGKCYAWDGQEIAP